MRNIEENPVCMNIRRRDTKTQRTPKPITLSPGIVNAGSTLNIRVYLRSSAVNCFQLFEIPHSEFRTSHSP